MKDEISNVSRLAEGDHDIDHVFTKISYKSKRYFTNQT